MEKVTQIRIYYRSGTFRWFCEKGAVRGDTPKKVNPLTPESFDRVLNIFRGENVDSTDIIKIDLDGSSHLINLSSITEIVMLSGGVGEQDSPDLPGPCDPPPVNDTPREPVIR